MRVYWWLRPPLLVLAVVMSLSIACGSSGNNDPATPTSTPATPSSSPSTKATPSPSRTPLALTPTPLLEGPLSDLTQLGSLYGFDGNHPEVKSIEAVVWTDGCMELAEPGLCNIYGANGLDASSTAPGNSPLNFGNGPGQRVTLVADGREWVYHVGPGGYLFAGVSGHLEKIFDGVRRELSQRLDVPLDAIEILKVQRVVWANECLGVSLPEHGGKCPGPGGFNPGCRITLRARDKEFTFHASRLARWVQEPAR